MRNHTAAVHSLRFLFRVSIVAVVLIASACSSSNDSAKKAKTAAFATTGSVSQVFVMNAKPGTKLTLTNSGGKQVQVAKADRAGSLIFRNVTPGEGYRVSDSDATSSPIAVLPNTPAPPSTKIYNQKLPTGWAKDGSKLDKGGYGYLTVRDGTKLAINVHPGGPADKGPYPTVIEYSGYAYARPGGGESSIAPVWNTLGYTVVDVNMRGTGCSGGAFAFFEPNQILDGYDVIETVARQPWALNHKAGMIGISFGGFSQLFVAQTNPPHLAAITPNSVLEGVMSTLRPGGMLNNGFALSWAAGRDADAKPASKNTGQSWAWERITSGDKTCKSNQKLHSQAVNLVDTINRVKTYVPSIVDPITLTNVVPKIKVPTFLSCQFTDEQTGGYCPFLTDHFTSAKSFHAAYTNGTHVDALGPVQLQHQFDLLEMEVANRIPNQKILDEFAPAIYTAEMQVGRVTMPDDPIADASSLSQARERYAALPTVQVLYDTGQGSDVPGAPVAGFSHGFTGLRDPSIAATPYFFGANGTLTTAKPTSSSSVSFHWDPTARPRNSMKSDDVSAVWHALPKYAWKQVVPGKAVAFITEPLKDDVVTFGGGAVNVWLRSSASDTDLQATISEVRPDGQELFVQNGWLRASYRVLDTKRSNPLQPVLSGHKAAIAPLPNGKWTKVSIPMYAQGHAYRKGSRIRVTIQAPGGDQPSWAFETLRPHDNVVDSIAISQAMPSSILLPVVRGLEAPTPLPKQCAGMRGQPCRTYAEFANTSSS